MAILLFVFPGCRSEEPPAAPDRISVAEELTEPPPELEPAPEIDVSRLLAEEPLGPEREPLQLRPEYHAGQRLRFSLLREAHVVVTVSADHRRAATSIDDGIAIGFEVLIEESEKYNPLLFTVEFDSELTRSTANENNSFERLAGARWQCRRSESGTTCADLTSGDVFPPPLWMVFFHAPWLPQRAATLDLTWQEPDTRLVGMDHSIEGDLSMEVLRISPETGQVTIRFSGDGATTPGFFEDTPFHSAVHGELAVDTRSRTLSRLNYDVVSFVPPDQAGNTSARQRRSEIHFELTAINR